MGRMLRDRHLRGAALLLTTLPLSPLGCGSKESAPATSSSAAATATQEAAPATATATATAAAAPPGADLDKREMSPFDLDRVTSEFGSPKAPPEKRVTYQKLFRQVAGGQEGYCGTHTSGSVVCWGRVPVDGMSGAFVQVAVADKFACGVESGGTLTCRPDSDAPALTAASAAPSPSAAPSTGEAPAEPAAPADVKYKAVAAGPGHACALDREGHATCWAAQGACALPAAPSDVTFRSLSVGTCHVCGRDTKEAVRCWAPEAAAAATPPAGLVAKELASGGGFTCAIDEKRALVCWGSAPPAPSDLPPELESIGARGGSLCAIAKGGALRCWGALKVTQPGPFTSLAVAAASVCATAAKDRIECFGDEKNNQLSVPEDPNMLAALDPGRTSEEIAASKKRRADTFRDFLSKLPERAPPITLDRTSKIPVGRVVEDQYLPVLDMVNFNQFFPTSHYHHGFAIKAPDKKFRLLVVHDGATPKLLSFNDDGKRLAQLPLTAYKMNTPDPTLLDCGDVKEEVVTESTIDPDLKITVKTTTVLESLGRLKNKEGKIQNFCKIRETTDVYALSPAGSIDKLSTKSAVLHDKIADEACRGKWFHDPRPASYAASEDMPEACQKRLGKH